MSTQLVTGFALSNGLPIPLSTTITDGSNSQELKTNSTYSVTSQSLGTFAEGRTVTHMAITAATGISYAGILRNGQFISICQSMGSESLGGMPQVATLMPSGVTLVAGDQIIVRTEA
jgi:hypothetical protein